MNTLVKFSAVMVAAVLALSMAARPGFAANPPDSTTVAKLLNQAKQHASAANDDAGALEAYARAGMSWQLHAEGLNAIKEHVNDLFQDYYQLQRIRDKGTPKQREAIDRLEPLLRDVATSLINTYQALNEHPTLVNMPTFRTRVSGDWERINKVYQYLCQCTSKSLKS